MPYQKPWWFLSFRRCSPLSSGGTDVAEISPVWLDHITFSFLRKRRQSWMIRNSTPISLFSFDGDFMSWFSISRPHFARLGQNKEIRISGLWMTDTEFQMLCPSRVLSYVAYSTFSRSLKYTTKLQQIIQSAKYSRQKKFFRAWNSLKSQVRYIYAHSHL